DSYRGKLFTLNFHGRRANVERLERSGSGYVGRHDQDSFFARDPWFRGIDLTYGPDGSVFVLDWSDTGECHEHNGVHSSSGRIFKLTYKNVKLNKVADILKLDEQSILQLQGHPNEWYVRQARLALSARFARGEVLEASRKKLSTICLEEPDTV